jgi:hypothetical protein
MLDGVLDRTPDTKVAWLEKRSATTRYIVNDDVEILHIDPCPKHYRFVYRPDINLEYTLLICLQVEKLLLVVEIWH